MKWYKVYMEPKSPITSDIPSTTIVGTIVQNMSILYPDQTLNEFLEEIDKRLYVSSAMPYVDYDNKRHLFYPAPIYRPIEGIPIRDIKKIKKIKWIENSMYKEWLKEDITSDFIKEHVSGRIVLKDSLNIGELYSDLDIPGNSIDLMSGASMDIYYKNGIKYSKNVGLYFILGVEEVWCNKVLGALNYINDAGIGGKISSGEGHVVVNYKEVDENPLLILWDNSPDTFIAFSNYIPTKNEWENIRLEKSHYSLKKWEARKSSGKITHSIHMFQAGSMFRFSPPDKKAQLGKYESKENYLYYGISLGIWVKGE